MIRSFLFAAGLAALAGPAFAFPALTTAQAGFLAGPGADYDSLGTLPSGARVDVIWCGTHKNWCLVETRHKMGWVPQDDLVDNTHKSFAAIDNSNGGGGAPGAPGGKKGGGEAAAMATDVGGKGGGNNGPIGVIHLGGPYAQPIH